MNQKISNVRSPKMSQQYGQEYWENAKRIKALRLELKKSEGKRMGIDTFLEAVRRYTNAAEIHPAHHHLLQLYRHLLRP